MSEISLQARDLLIITGDLPVACQEILVSFAAYKIGEGELACPSLAVSVKAEEGQQLLSLVMERYEEIDALRRYCEMTLDLFDRDRLE